MANIRIKENKNKFTVTVDEYPKIKFTASTYEEARDKAVALVKAELSKIPVPKVEEEKKSGRVTMGFAAGTTEKIA